MKKFVVFDATGRITQTGSVPEHMLELQRNGGRLVAEGDGHWDTHYVVDGAVQPRPENPANANGNALADLPAPCTIYINDKAYPCTEGHAELAFGYPGTYQVRVESFPYLDANFEVVQP